jgi:hypothetical protein
MRRMLSAIRPISHDFWNMQGRAVFIEKLRAQEHVSIVGGLIVAALLSSRLEDAHP